VSIDVSQAMGVRRVFELDESQIEALAEVLIDCIESGAGVSFMSPLAPAKAQAFWRCVASDVAAGARAVLVAEDETGIVGTVQLVLEQPENQPHRADLSKLLVHRRARRRGLGAALMEAAEQTARDCGKSLLVLDTNEGSDADRLYVRLGWVRVGTIPNYSLQPQGGLRGATIFYKHVAPVRADTAEGSAHADT
jgi:GNAT superfamily N-acetyltransferase